MRLAYYSNFTKVKTLQKFKTSIADKK